LLFVMSEGSSFMVVDWLDDRLAPRQATYVFSHQGNVISSGMQSSDTSTQASSSIEYVIIVKADVRNTFLSEYSHHSIGQGRFP